MEAQFMSQQIKLFPDSRIPASEMFGDDRLIDQDIELNAVDEIFSASHRLHNHKEYVNLLSFISRFPNYSPFNCFLLFVQNPTISYVATARTWNRKFRRRPKIDARPLVILAPMGPIRFVFDIKDTEGHPLAEGLFILVRFMRIHSSIALSRVSASMKHPWSREIWIRPPA
jgi:hypothetical protein